MVKSGLRDVFYLILLTVIITKSAGSVLDNDNNDEEFYKRSPACEDQMLSSTCQSYKNRGFCAKGGRYYKSMEHYCPFTCDICKSVTEPAKPVETVPVNINECLSAHNSKRALHGAAPLRWDPVLARQAQEYAMKMAQTDDFVHDSKRGRVGENLQMFTAGWKSSFCKHAVEEWYSEVEYYPFSNPPSYLRGSFSHFVQVVWKSTRLVGVGIAKNRFYTYVVARYTPPGGTGYFAQNVGNTGSG